MTKREKQIWELLKLDPLISQKELAERLDISRSAVAGHIMNMINKGVILGKGYLLADNPYAVVIGGCNMDILGRPHTSFHSNDSLPGEIHTSPGGVARNIAENLARLGNETYLISAVGKDHQGLQILEQTAAAGVNTSKVLELEDAKTSSYLSVVDDKGEMQMAVSDMSILSRLTVSEIKEHEGLIRQCQVLVLDANLSEEVLEYLFSQFSNKPIFVDTVSVAKATKFAPYLAQIHTIKPNQIEAVALIQSQIQDASFDEDTEPHQLAATLTELGVANTYLSLGADGIIIQNADQQTYLTPRKADVINTNGAGDAFIAALAHCYLNDIEGQEAGQFALAASAVALSDVATINPNFSQSSVVKMMETTQ